MFYRIVGNSGYAMIHLHNDIMAKWTTKSLRFDHGKIARIDKYLRRECRYNLQTYKMNMTVHLSWAMFYHVETINGKNAITPF